MSKVRGKKVVRRSKRRKTVTTSPASLPPQVPAVDAGASDAIAVPKPPESEGSDTKPVKKAFWDVGKESKVYEQAMKILALRATGLDDKAIADAMGLSMQTVWNYCYTAGKNGWATDFQNAKDQIEFGIMPKVVRELEAGLGDNARHQTSGMAVRTAVALKIAEGTIFKKFEQVADHQQISNVIAIRIEHAPGALLEMRAGSGGGTPAYSEGEVVNEDTAKAEP